MSKHISTLEEIAKLMVEYLNKTQTKDNNFDKVRMQQVIINDLRDYLEINNYISRTRFPNSAVTKLDDINFTTIDGTTKTISTYNDTTWKVEK